MIIHTLPGCRPLAGPFRNMTAARNAAAELRRNGHPNADAAGSVHLGFYVYAGAGA